MIKLWFDNFIFFHTAKKNYHTHDFTLPNFLKDEYWILYKKKIKKNTDIPIMNMLYKNYGPCST